MKPDIYAIKQAITEQRHFLEIQGANCRWVVMDIEDATSLFLFLIGVGQEEPRLMEQELLEARLGHGCIESLMGMEFTHPLDHLPFPLTVVSEDEGHKLIQFEEEV